jgi:putative ABC transport system permease protein
MFLKMVINDFLRKKIITMAVFIFITLAVILGSSATSIIANLIQAMTELRDRALPADIAQMHIGDYDHAEIERFTLSQQNHIAYQETMYLLNIEGIHIHVEPNRTMADTVQDISFVVQNQNFDFILDLDNEKLAVKPGQIAVPIHFMVEYDLAVGETLIVKNAGSQKSFTIIDYARDYEMNSALTSSKRFVIHQNDYNEMLAEKMGEVEYLIQFKLTEGGDSQAVRTAYIEAGLASNGPTIDGKLFMVFNALSDAAVAMVIILISLLLVVVASLCIRLTFLATIDEDLREIGVMKAMGITKTDIRKVYLNKYRFMAVVAGIVGYLLSFIVVNLFNGNMRLYLSSNPTGSLQYVLSLLAPLLIYAMIVTYCRKVLRRIDRISAVEALRSDIMADDGYSRLSARKKHSSSLVKTRRTRLYRFPLTNNRIVSTNLYMGIRDVFRRFKLYRLLLLIFMVCTFIAIMPLNMYNTMNSPNFATYMGIGECDMRIDLRKTDTITVDFQRLLTELENDADIATYAPYITCSYRVLNAEKTWDYISIETGDFALFPLNYLSGRAPVADGEISISHANASKDSLDKGIGDFVVVEVEGERKSLKVVGIYQDISNGGKTAKATPSLGLNEEAVLWYMVNINVAPSVDIATKVAHYQDTFSSAQVNGMLEYMQQTLGNLIAQIGTVVAGGIGIALVIVVLITALFLRMLLSKDMSQIAIMRSVGLTTANIMNQYMAATMLVLAVGVVLGILAATHLGELLVSMAMSTMGAARIEFTMIAWQTWLVGPMVLISIVGITIWLGCKVTVKDDLSVVLRS